MKQEELEKIENPIVRKALKNRSRNFMFKYGDGNHTEHTEHTEAKYDDTPTHTDYSETNYREHSEYTDEYENHSEYDEYQPEGD